MDNKARDGKTYKLAKDLNSDPVAGLGAVTLGWGPLLQFSLQD